MHYFVDQSSLTYSTWYCAILLNCTASESATAYSDRMYYSCTVHQSYWYSHDDCVLVHVHYYSCGTYPVPVTPPTKGGMLP